MDDKKNPKGYTFEPPEMEEKFYYTTNHPHQWSSGPTYHYYDPYGKPVYDLERAKELAEQFYIGGYGENHCSTTYGVMIECRVKEKKKSKA